MGSDSCREKPTYTFTPNFVPSMQVASSDRLFFSVSGLTPRIPGLFTDTSEHIGFL